jgi:hypothetical protein
VILFYHSVCGKGLLMFQAGAAVKRSRRGAPLQPWLVIVHHADLIVRFVQ